MEKALNSMRPKPRTSGWAPCLFFTLVSPWCILSRAPTLDLIGNYSGLRLCSVFPACAHYLWPKCFRRYRLIRALVWLLWPALISLLVLWFKASPMWSHLMLRLGCCLYVYIFIFVSFLAQSPSLSLIYTEIVDWNICCQHSNINNSQITCSISTYNSVFFLAFFAPFFFSVCFQAARAARALRFIFKACLASFTRLRSSNGFS